MLLQKKIPLAFSLEAHIGIFEGTFTIHPTIYTLTLNEIICKQPNYVI